MPLKSPGKDLEVPTLCGWLWVCFCPSQTKGGPMTRERVISKKTGHHPWVKTPWPSGQHPGQLPAQLPAHCPATGTFWGSCLLLPGVHQDFQGRARSNWHPWGGFDKERKSPPPSPLRSCMGVQKVANHLPPRGSCPEAARPLMGHILGLPIGPILVICFLLAPHPVLVETRCPWNTWGLPNGRKQGSEQAPQDHLTSDMCNH